MAFIDITAKLDTDLMDQFIENNTALIESENEPLSSIIKKPFNFTSIKSYQIVFPGVFKYYSPGNAEFDLNEENEDETFILKNQSVGFLQNMAGLEGTLIKLSSQLVSGCPNLLIPTQSIENNQLEFCGRDCGYLIENPVLHLTSPANQRDQIPHLIGFYNLNLIENTQILYKSKTIKAN